MWTPVIQTTQLVRASGHEISNFSTMHMLPDQFQHGQLQHAKKWTAGTRELTQGH